MEEFKDRVKIVRCSTEIQSPGSHAGKVGTYIGMHDEYYQVRCEEFVCYAVEIELIKEKTVDRYTELKQRIEGLRNGWDKEADDILNEIYKEKGELPAVYINIFCGSQDRIEIEDESHHTLEKFSFEEQCGKLTAFKFALLWLLDHSNIKRDEKQEKLTALETQLKDIQRQIEELKK